MINLIDFNSKGLNVSIPVTKITRVTELSAAMKDSGYRTFIATGPDNEDGGENGWYVSNSLMEVKQKLDSAIEALK